MRLVSKCCKLFALSKKYILYYISATFKASLINISKKGKKFKIIQQPYYITIQKCSYSKKRSKDYFNSFLACLVLLRTTQNHHKKQSISILMTAVVVKTSAPAWLRYQWRIRWFLQYMWISQSYNS